MDEQSRFYRRLFGRFATGVAVVLAEDEGQTMGITINSLTSTSLDPLLLLFCINKQSRSGRSILRTGRFTVNILGAHQEDIARHFSNRTELVPDLQILRGGQYIWLARSNAVFRCDLEASHPGGDHRIIVGRVTGLHGPDECERLLIYHEGRYVHLASRRTNDELMEIPQP
jgi:flavin reductase (DIM6/NTAB) family NADH-FMN oxidoreductase RutF